MAFPNVKMTRRIKTGHRTNCTKPYFPIYQKRIMTHSTPQALTQRALISTLSIFMLSVFATGCSSADKKSPTGPDTPVQSLTYESIDQSAVEFETIDQGIFGSGQEETLRVVRDRDKFESLWRDIHGDDAQIPEVDFSEKIVLSAVLGTRSTGGYQAKIEDITRDRNSQTVNVSVKEIKPGPNCLVAQVITVPYHIVETETFSTNQVRFQDGGTSTRDCD